MPEPDHDRDRRSARTLLLLSGWSFIAAGLCLVNRRSATLFLIVLACVAGLIGAWFALAVYRHKHPQSVLAWAAALVVTALITVVAYYPEILSFIPWGEWP